MDVFHRLLPSKTSAGPCLREAPGMSAIFHPSQVDAATASTRFVSVSENIQILRCPRSEVKANDLLVPMVTGDTLFRPPASARMLSDKMCMTQSSSSHLRDPDSRIPSDSRRNNEGRRSAGLAQRFAGTEWSATRAVLGSFVARDHDCNLESLFA
jgi:hypothetical protein